MRRLSAEPTDNFGAESLLFIVTPITSSECSVVLCEFGELVLFVLINLVIDGNQQLLDLGHSNIELFLSVCGNKDVQRFVVVGILVLLTFLLGSFASNGNLGSRLSFKLFVGIATRTNNQAYEIVVGIFVYGNGDFCCLLDSLWTEVTGRLQKNIK